ncbi:MAG: hypothetical protein AW09_001622 [Candidatus Accumulibacter phosphatis]|uniref:Uncharacterized protein n=1 Tax=Candidatus Accumulibacter phosphatis TaxID=327160 RepID=A0A080LWR9_9PROT|nr:MAG: hypothetical protein AW09_001622 [Candidatus Accumulibacter phosphatis]
MRQGLPSASLSRAPWPSSQRLTPSIGRVRNSRLDMRCPARQAADQSCMRGRSSGCSRSTKRSKLSDSPGRGGRPYSRKDSSLQITWPDAMSTIQLPTCAMTCESASSRSCSRSLFSACLRSVISREIPNSPMTFPSPSRSGPLVARKVRAPSAVESVSSYVLIRFSAITRRSLARSIAACSGGKSAVSSQPGISSAFLSISRAAPWLKAR